MILDQGLVQVFTMLEAKASESAGRSLQQVKAKHISQTCSGRSSVTKTTA